jgi:polyisoprenoid-binding protein YceI
MISKRLGAIFLGLAATTALSGCSAISPRSAPDVSLLAQDEGKTGLKATYADLGNAGGKVFELDPHASIVRMYAFRGGRAAKLAHNHVLSAPQFTGFFYLSPGGPSESRFDLEFRLDQLEIDNPAHRALLGSAFSTKLSPADIAGSRKHMLGNENLQADQFPYVRIHSLQIAGDGTKFAAKVQVEMHGQKREMWVPLDVEGLSERLSVTGSMVLRQTDFGAQPYTVLNGLIAVLDEVVVEFKLIGG